MLKGSLLERRYYLVFTLCFLGFGILVALLTSVINYQTNFQDIDKKLTELADFEVEDKRTHEYKGLFVSAKFAQEFKIFLEDKISKEQQEKLQRVIQYAGKGKIKEDFDNSTSSELKMKKSMEQYSEK